MPYLQVRLLEPVEPRMDAEASRIIKPNSRVTADDPKSYCELRPNDRSVQRSTVTVSHTTASHLPVLHRAGLELFCSLIRNYVKCGTGKLSRFESAYSSNDKVYEQNVRAQQCLTERKTHNSVRWLRSKKTIGQFKNLLEQRRK